MLSKYSKRINFPKISGKVEKDASRKGQVKLLLLGVYTKIKEMRTFGYNDVETRCQ